MGLIGRVLMLPLAPVEGVMWVARTLQQVAERELNDPAALRARLQEAQDAHARGQLSDDELSAVEDALFQRLVELQSTPRG